MLPAWSFCKFSAFVHSFSSEHVNQVGTEQTTRVHTHAHGRAHTYTHTHSPRETKHKKLSRAPLPVPTPQFVSRPAEIDFRRASHLSTLRLAHCSDFAGVSFFTQRSCQAPARCPGKKPTPRNLPPLSCMPLSPSHSITSRGTAWSCLLNCFMLLFERETNVSYYL